MKSHLTSQTNLKALWINDDENMLSKNQTMISMFLNIHKTNIKINREENVHYVLFIIIQVFHTSEFYYLCLPYYVDLY